MEQGLGCCEHVCCCSGQAAPFLGLVPISSTGPATGTRQGGFGALGAAEVAGGGPTAQP